MIFLKTQRSTMNTPNGTTWFLLDNTNTSDESTQTNSLRCPSFGVDSGIGITVQTVIYSLLLIASLGGNCLIIAVTVKNTKTKTPINYFIINMCMSDLLVPVFAVRSRISKLYSAKAWLIGGGLGSMLCKLVPFCADISTAVSIQSLVLIALDRFFAVVYPLRKPIFNRRRCKLAMLLSWFIAVLFHSPYFYTFRLFSSGGHLYCLSSWKPAFSDNLKTAEEYYLVVFTSLYAAPLLLMCSLYAMIAYELKRKRPHRAYQSNRSIRKRSVEDRNAISMMFTIVLVFVVCYTLSHAYIFLHFNYVELLGCNQKMVLEVSQYLVHSNGALNPIIYVIFTRKYSLAVRTYIRRLSSSFSLHERNSVEV